MQLWASKLTQQQGFVTHLWRGDAKNILRNNSQYTRQLLDDKRLPFDYGYMVIMSHNLLFY